jgi:hypothetical protein
VRGAECSRHGRYPERCVGGLCAAFVSHAACSSSCDGDDGGGGGTTRALHLLAVPSTPAYLMVLTAVVAPWWQDAPAERAGRDRVTRRTRSSAMRRTRSCAIGGRKTYLHKASRPVASSAFAVVAACREKPPSVAHSTLVCMSCDPPRSLIGPRRRSAGPAGSVPATEEAASSASAGSRASRRPIRRSRPTTRR